MSVVIKHIWFDFSETLARINRTEHNKLKYSTYAAVLGRQNDAQLKAEFDEQYELHHHSISDIFHSLGKPAGWWSNQLAAIEPSKLFELIDDDIPALLQKIGQQVPISMFSNINLEQVLPALGIEPSWFRHILSSGMVGRPKPALDGFYKIVELSHLKPAEILYIGDHVAKDVEPAQKVGLKAGIIWSHSKRADYNFKTFNDILKLAQQ